MNQLIFTVIARVLPGKKADLEDRLRDLQYLGVPTAGDRLGLGALANLHFCSLFLYDDPTDGWLLVFESNIDGTADAYFAQIASSAASDAWESVFDLCEGFAGRKIAAYPPLWLERMQRPVAQYVGAPGRTVAQIRLEARGRDLAETTLQATHGLDEKAAAARVRQALETDAATTGYLTPTQPINRRLQFWAAVIGLVVFVLAIIAAIAAIAWAIWPAAQWWLVVPGAVLAFALLVALFVLLPLRWIENGAPEDVSRPERAHVRDVTAFEDHLATNHMVSVVHLHQDWFRRWARRAVSRALNAAVYLTAYEGKLGPIPTIHFAHWAIVNEGRRLMFVSNFDGSWESYLDDFTLKAAPGLTAAWAFGLGFPKARWLIRGGAANAEAFIDWARRSMVPSLVWYMAYPGLSTERINGNSRLRNLICADRNAVNAGKWLERI